MCEVRGQVPRGARRHVIVPAKSKKLLVKKSVANGKMSFSGRKTPVWLRGVCLLYPYSPPLTPSRQRFTRNEKILGSNPGTGIVFCLAWRRAPDCDPAI